MGQQDANVSRLMFDERKRYIRPIAQEQIPWVDADQNDGTKATLTHLRRSIQSTMGDGYVNDGFKIRECDDTGIRYNGNTNNFVVVGQDLSVSPRVAVTDGEDSGAYFISGLRCALFGDVIYNADDPIPDQSGDPDSISQSSIFPRVTDIEYTGGNTVITDSAQNYVTNELTGRTISFLNGGVLGSFSIASNTSTTITINGTDLTSSVYVFDRYRIDLSTPSGSDRTDGVYLNVYLDEINAAEDYDLYHSLNTPTEAQIREQIVQEIFVREDIGTHGDLTDYEDSDGNQHYVQKLVEIDRLDGDDTITTAMIQADNITQFGSILQNSPFQTYGSSQHANDSSAVDNMPVDGSWPNAPATVPDGGYWIAREIDDNSNPAGYYSNVSGTWTWMFEVEVERALDISYDNTTSGLSSTDIQNAMDEVVADSHTITYKNTSGGTDNNVTSPSTLDEVVSELSGAVDNASVQYTMQSGDGYSELSSIASAINTAGVPAQITFEPGSYSIALTSTLDFGSADVTLIGYGRGISIINLTGDYDAFLSTGRINSYSISINVTRTSAGKLISADKIVCSDCHFEGSSSNNQELYSANSVNVYDSSMEDPVVINGGDESGMHSSYFYNGTTNSYTFNFGNESVIETTKIDDVRLEITMGNYSVCSFYGKSTFRKLTQGTHSEVRGGHITCDGDYALQSGDFGWINQLNYSDFSGCRIDAVNVEPVQDSAIILQAAGDSTISDVYLYFDMTGTTWSTNGVDFRFFWGSSYLILSGVSAEIKPDATFSGDNITLSYFDGGVGSSASSYSVYVKTGSFTDSGTDNELKITAESISCSQLRSIDNTDFLLRVYSDYVSTSFISGFISSSDSYVSNCYIVKSVDDGRHVVGNYVGGRVTCASTSYVVGNYIGENVAGNGRTQCNVAHNTIHINVTGGGSHLTDNIIHGTISGTWTKQHGNT